MSEPAAPHFAYDTVDYPTAVVPAMAPERIKATGVLHGWLAPDPANARVLEIGGADGLNALAIAAASPNAHVEAFDLGGMMVDRGQRLAKAAGLSNVDVSLGDILAWPRDGKQFDYIITHGVYAWTPAPVRRALLQLIGARLAPGGVAYVSYDCLPAAASKYALAQFLYPRVSHLPDAGDRARAALDIMGVLAANQRPDSRLKLQLDIFLKELPGARAEHIFHDLLAEHYQPTSFEDFAKAAAEAGLSVMGDAGLLDLYIDDLDARARTGLAQAGQDRVARGVLLDMLHGSTMFRRTLLSRTDAPPAPATLAALDELRFETKAKRLERMESGKRIIAYDNGRGSSIAPGAPHIEAMMDLLIEADPREVSFGDLHAAAGSPAIPVTLAPLRMACLIDLIVAHGSPQPFGLPPAGDRPVASPLARAMLAGSDQAVTLRHVPVTVSDPGLRALATLCDGTRNREQLRMELAKTADAEIGPNGISDRLQTLARMRLLRA